MVRNKKFPKLKSLLSDEFFATKLRPMSFRLPYADNSNMDVMKAIELAKNLMMKFDGISCEPKTDAMMIMSDPERAKDVQAYLDSTGYKLAKQPISDDIENTGMISPLVKFNIKDLDADKRKNVPWQKDNRIKSVKEDSTEPSGIRGLNKTNAKRKLYKILKVDSFTKNKIYSDTSWQPIRAMFKLLQDAGIEYVISKTEYQKNQYSEEPTSKRWSVEISFKNDKQIDSKLYLNIVAGGAGSVQDPLGKYDLVVTLS